MAALIGSNVVPGDDVPRVIAYLDDSFPTAPEDPTADGPTANPHGTGWSFDSDEVMTSIVAGGIGATSSADSGYATALSYGSYTTPPWSTFGLPTAVELFEGGTGSIETWGLIGE